MPCRRCRSTLWVAQAEQHSEGTIAMTQLFMAPGVEHTETATPITRAPIITVDHLVKRYKKADANAVDDISFSVPMGSLFALLGPNVAGKTTSISILTTTLLPTSGSISIAGY